MESGENASFVVQVWGPGFTAENAEKPTEQENFGNDSLGVPGVSALDRFVK